ncbi:MAG: hypothetical protein IBX41_03700 [Methanophagales archaeon]|nr:hypothetical protein [Methanophagales archaeon]
MASNEKSRGLKKFAGIVISSASILVIFTLTAGSDDNVQYFLNLNAMVMTCSIV